MLDNSQPVSVPPGKPAATAPVGRDSLASQSGLLSCSGQEPPCTWWGARQEARAWGSSEPSALSSRLFEGAHHTLL